MKLQFTLVILACVAATSFGFVSFLKKAYNGEKERLFNILEKKSPLFAKMAEQMVEQAEEKAGKFLEKFDPDKAALCMDSM